MSSKSLQKRSSTEASHQNPKPKKQKKQIPNTPAPTKAVANGDETAVKLTAAQRKRQTTKKRKLEAIARITEQGGVPKPLWSAKKEKSKEKGDVAKNGDAEPQKLKTAAKNENKNKSIEKLKAKQEKRAESKQVRKEKRQQEGQYKPEKVNLSVEEIRLRIAEIKGRGEITKTGKRKLGVLIKKLAIEEGTATASNSSDKINNKEEKKNLSKSEKRRLRRDKKDPAGGKEDADSQEENDQSVEKPVNIQLFEKKKKQKVAGVKNLGPATVDADSKIEEKKLGGKKNEKQVKEKQTLNRVNNKNIKLKVKKEESINEDKSEDDATELEAEEEAEDESSNDEGEEDDKEELDSSQQDVKNEEEDDDDDDDDDDEEEEEEDDDEEEEEDDDDDDDDGDEIKDDSEIVKEETMQKTVKKAEGKGKKEGQGLKKKLDQENPEKKKRYILFVGNIPFDTKPEDLKKHFLSKVNNVLSVRIPTKSGTQIPQGFGFVEVSNDVDYEKGLSLHHTLMSGRRINVEYTLPGSKQVSKRKDLISKNQKLHAMRKAGKLAGSQKHDQKRSVRRFKKKEQDRQAK